MQVNLSALFWEHSIFYFYPIFLVNFNPDEIGNRQKVKPWIQQQVQLAGWGSSLLYFIIFFDD